MMRQFMLESLVTVEAGPKSCRCRPWPPPGYRAPYRGSTSAPRTHAWAAGGPPCPPCSARFGSCRHDPGAPQCSAETRHWCPACVRQTGAISCNRDHLEMEILIWNYFIILVSKCLLSIRSWLTEQQNSPVDSFCKPLQNPNEVVPPIGPLLLPAEDARRVHYGDPLEHLGVGARALEPVEEGVPELGQGSELLLGIHHQRVARDDPVSVGVHHGDEPGDRRAEISKRWLEQALTCLWWARVQSWFPGSLARADIL